MSLGPTSSLADAAAATTGGRVPMACRSRKGTTAAVEGWAAETCREAAAARASDAGDGKVEGAAAGGRGGLAPLTVEVVIAALGPASPSSGRAAFFACCTAGIEGSCYPNAGNDDS